METNCKNCKNAIEDNSVSYCKLLKVQEYEKDGSLSTRQYKVVDPKINSHCISFETKTKA